MTVKYFKTETGYARSEREEKQEIHRIDDNGDTIVEYVDAEVHWPEGEEVTEAEYTAAITALETAAEDRVKKDNDEREALKSSALKKLAKLGLSEDEAKALVS